MIRKRPTKVHFVTKKLRLNWNWYYICNDYKNRRYSTLQYIDNAITNIEKTKRFDSLKSFTGSDGTFFPLFHNLKLSVSLFPLPWGFDLISIHFVDIKLDSTLKKYRSVFKGF